MHEIVLRGKENKLLLFFFFFLSFPVFNIGVSLSFVPMIFLIISLKMRGIKIFKNPHLVIKLLLVFYFVSILSLVFSKPTWEPVSVLSDIKILTQLIYWIFIANIIYKSRNSLDFNKISRTIFIGSLLFIAFVFVAKYDGVFYRLHGIKAAQNAIAFYLILNFGISIYYLNKKFGLIGSIFGICIFVFATVYTQSRTGGILILIQSILILLRSIPVIKKYIPVLITSLLIISIYGIIEFNKENSEVRNYISNEIEDYSPELAFIISNPDIVFSQDKSWIGRKLAFSKGVNMFNKYPILGVGFFRYSRAVGKVDKYNSIVTPEMMKKYKKKSAHNSYIMIIAETGMLGAIPMLLVLIICLKIGLTNYISKEVDIFYTYLSISFVTSLVYFWVISAYTDSIYFTYIGLILASSIKIYDKN